MRLTLMLAATAMSLPMAPAMAESGFVDRASTTDTPACRGKRQAGYVTDKPRVSASRLGDMPPATHIKAVYRMMDGCPAPIIVAREVGNAKPGAKADDPALPATIMPATTNVGR